MTLVSIPLMDRTGRRTLHLYGLGGMFIFSIFITISFLIKASPHNLSRIIKYITVDPNCIQWYDIAWNALNDIIEQYMIGIVLLHEILTLVSANNFFMCSFLFGILVHLYLSPKYALVME